VITLVNLLDVGNRWETVSVVGEGGRRYSVDVCAITPTVPRRCNGYLLVPVFLRPWKSFQECFERLCPVASSLNFIEKVLKFYVDFGEWSGSSISLSHSSCHTGVGMRWAVSTAFKARFSEKKLDGSDKSEHPFLFAGGHSPLP
jgi:hypothetical protein